MRTSTIEYHIRDDDSAYSSHLVRTRTFTETLLVLVPCDEMILWVDELAVGPRGE